MIHIDAAIIEDLTTWAPLLLVLAIALRARFALLALAAIFVAGCASSPTPTCAELGCTKSVVCTSRQGPCYCAEPSGARAECVPSWLAPDAGSAQ